MPEQDNEPAEPESSSDGAMEELADIVSGKKPAPPAAKNSSRRPARSNRLSKIALIIGLVANVIVTPLLCILGFPFGLKIDHGDLTEGAIGEFALLVAASLLPVVAGVVCSVIAMRRARASGRGDTVPILALLSNLLPPVVGILTVLKGMYYNKWGTG
jgi:hypothetical protein